MTNSQKDMSIQKLAHLSDFLDHHKEQPECGEKRPCDSHIHWSYALTEIRKDLFTNSSATISAPIYYILDYERKAKISQDQIPRIAQLAEMEKTASTYEFNAQPFASQDIYSYRRLRSEHLLIRVAHCVDLDKSSYMFIRLSQGIFLMQKYKPAEPLQFPTITSFNQSFQIVDDTIPIDTFSFNILFNDMMRQTQAAIAEQMEASFLPYTYTLGIRYTNPYQGARDIVVRGNIPLWCQTLMITECMRQLPILPNTTRQGLLPFLKHMDFHFTTMSAVKDGCTDPYPDLLLIFERFAMELCEPQMIWQDVSDQMHRWEDTRKKILDLIVFCDIPDPQAAYITSVANEWAKSQGILLQ